MWNHGVAEVEVEQVLRRPGEDRPGQGGARVAIGQTQEGRYLRVIYVPEAGTESERVNPNETVVAGY